MTSESDQINACLDLALMPMRVGLAAVEATLKEVTKIAYGSQGPDEWLSISDVQIEAAAAAIKAKLMEGRDVGFQNIIRTSLPPDIIWEVARSALKAASTTVQGPAK